MHRALIALLAALLLLAPSIEIAAGAPPRGRRAAEGMRRTTVREATPTKTHRPAESRRRETTHRSKKQIERAAEARSLLKESRSRQERASRYADMRKGTRESADRVNKTVRGTGFKYREAPYRAGTEVRRFKQSSEHNKFYRLYAEGQSGKEGRWLVEGRHLYAADGRKLSAAELQKRFALPFKPDRIAEAHTRRGVEFRTATAAAVEFKRLDGQKERYPGGARQYEVQNFKKAKDRGLIHFGHSKPLK